MATLRTMFMGTAELACPILRAVAAGTELLAVVTQPDRPRGRHLQIQYSAVKAAALELNLPVLQPAKARDPEFISAVAQIAPELIVVVAYGQILPATLLPIPRLGCINVHTSILPKYRGAAPIQAALLNGESKTGVTIMKMDEGLDTGPIIRIVETAIEPSDNAETLHDRLGRIGAEAIVPTILEYASGRLEPHRQPAEGASYAPKISREDGRIDWRQPAEVIWNRIRAFTPWPGAYTFQKIGDKERLLKIWKAEIVPSSAAAAAAEPGTILKAEKSGIVVASANNALNVTELQREGGRRMSAQEFLAGGNLKEGEKLH